jgi:hypothetical protein
MNAKNKTLFILFFLIISAIQIFAQKTKEDKKFSLRDHLWYGINVGNIGIGYNQFNINLSLMGGYKITNSINAGLIFHNYYTYAWQQGSGNNKSYYDFGIGALATVKIFRNIYAHAEVDQMYLDDFNVIDPKSSYLFTYLGGTYKYSSGSKWAMSLSLLYNLNPDSNRLIFPLDYRAAFVYNF